MIQNIWVMFLTWTSSGCMAPILACLPLCGNNWYLHAFIRFQSRSQRPHPVTDAAVDHTWRTHTQEEPEKIASLHKRLAKRTDLTCSFQHLTIAVLELLWKYWNLGNMTLCEYCKSLISVRRQSFFRSSDNLCTRKVCLWLCQYQLVWFALVLVVLRAEQAKQELGVGVLDPAHLSWHSIPYLTVGGPLGLCSKASLVSRL